MRGNKVELKAHKKTTLLWKHDRKEKKPNNQLVN